MGQFNIYSTNGCPVHMDASMSRRAENSVNNVARHTIFVCLLLILALPGLIRLLLGVPEKGTCPM